MQAFITTLPRLEGEDSLKEVSRVMVGTGSMEKDAAKEVLREWQRMAGISLAKRATTEDEKKLELAARGIQIG